MSRQKFIDDSLTPLLIDVNRMPYDGHMTEDIVAEIVATVLEVSARPGQEVAVGDTVVLLDSMKMEIPVLAEYDGVLAEVRVAPGDQVRAGDVLATYRD